MASLTAPTGEAQPVRGARTEQESGLTPAPHTHTGAENDTKATDGGAVVVGGAARASVASPVESNSLSAKLTKLGSAPSFDGRTFSEFTTPAAAPNVVATRGNPPVNSTKQTVATRGNSRPVVEAVKSSKGTWQFRLRWNSEPGRPVHYVLTVADSTYEIIRRGNYEGFKKALIAEFEASAVSAD